MRRQKGRARSGQELRPIYNFPATIFVEQNSGGKQLDHVMSEVDEVVANCLDESIPFDDITHEMADLTHSLETYWRILERTHGRDYVQATFREVEHKNRQRGYYAEPAA